MNKELLVEKINNSILFQINDNKTSAAYIKEKERVLEALYQYKLLESSENVKYGVEIVETFADCINYYDIEKGPFLHYYNSAFSLRKSKAHAKSALEELNGGLRVSDTETRNTSKLARYLKKHPEISPSEIIQDLDSFAGLFQIAPESLRDVVQLYVNSIVIFGDEPIQKDNTNFSLFDQISDPQNHIASLIESTQIPELITAFDLEYKCSRTKTQPLLQYKTNYLFAEHDILLYRHEGLSNTSFYNEEIYSSSKMSDVDLGRLLGMSKSNISQIWKRYLDRVKNRIRNVL